MKLTDLVSPEEFAAAFHRNVLAYGEDPHRDRSIAECTPYLWALHANPDSGVLELDVDEMSSFMSALSVFQQCLNEKEIPS